MIHASDLHIVSAPGRLIRWSLTLRNDSSERSPIIKDWFLCGPQIMDVQLPTPIQIEPFEFITLEVSLQAREASCLSTLVAVFEDDTALNIPVEIEVRKPKTPLAFNPDYDPKELFA